MVSSGLRGTPMLRSFISVLSTGFAALAMTAMSASAQVYPPQAQSKLLRGSGVFTQQSTYQGPIIGYVNTSISSPFTFSLSYFNFYGSDTILPGTVQITDPELFHDQTSLTGSLSISMTGTDYSIGVTNNPSIEYLTLGLNLDAALPTASGPVPVEPGSTIGFSGRFFSFTGSVTSLAVGPAAAVPEVATWAMMMAGFYLVGLTARRRQSGDPSFISVGVR